MGPVYVDTEQYTYIYGSIEFVAPHMAMGVHVVNHAAIYSYLCY